MFLGWKSPVFFCVCFFIPQVIWLPVQLLIKTTLYIFIQEAIVPSLVQGHGWKVITVHVAHSMELAHTSYS